MARTLKRYNIDIAALSETRFSGESSLEEIGGGYTIYWIGNPEGVPRTGGVALAIRSSIAQCLETLPKGINDRLIIMRMKLTSRDT